MAVTERRKRREIRKTITQILEEVQAATDLHYGGDFDSHILEIFNELPDPDKTTFLRRSFELHWKNQITLAQSGMEDVLVVSGEESLRIDPVSIDLEKKNLEKINAEEQLKLKSWLHKAGLVTGIVAAIVAIVTTVSLGGNSTDIVDIVKNFNSIIELLLK